MTIVQRVETYVSPRDAERITGVPRTRLARLLRRGTLTQFRTKGGHLRYALSELRALHASLQRQRKVPQAATPSSYFSR